MKKQIDDVLNFRSDLSPFLVHLTKSTNTKPAKEILEEIIRSNKLLQSGKKISDVRFGCRDFDWDCEKIKNLFSAICFTETPLNEIHCLLEIDKRKVDLEPFGFIFLKKKLVCKNVSPVLYLNNYGKNIEGLVRSIGDIISLEEYPKEFNKLCPLISVVGYKFPIGSIPQGTEIVDFSWEREWRFPYCYGNFDIDYDDVFLGLCPDEYIEYFEALMNRNGISLPFIDPRRPATWYAAKIIDRRNQCGITEAVI